MRKPDYDYYEEQDSNFMAIGDHVYGETGHFEMVPYRLIRIDGSYNRSAATAKNAIIAETTGLYDPYSFRPVNLSRRDDGFYYLYDGIQRQELLRMIATDLTADSIRDFRVPAWVHNDMLKEDEHRALVNTNNKQRHLNIAELWKVRYDGGDIIIRELTEVFREHGLGLGLRSANGIWAASAGQGNPLRFTALSALNVYFVNHMLLNEEENYDENIAVLNKTLDILTRSFTEGMPGYQQRLSSVIFLTVLQFSKDNYNINNDDIITVLSHEHNLTRLIDIIKWNVIKINSRLQISRYPDIGADVLAAIWNKFWENDKDKNKLKITVGRNVDLRTQEEAMRDLKDQED